MCENGLSQHEMSEIPLRSPNEHWKRVFKKYDKNDDNYISIRELDDLIQSREYEKDIPEHVVARIHSLSDTNGDHRLDYAEFLKMVHNPDFEPIFGHLIRRYIHMIVPRRREIVTPDSVDGLYEDEYTCCPPPVGMIIISLIEVLFYCIDLAYDSGGTATGPIASALIYDPRRRYEAWRYITYMFVHVGILHILINLLVQILIGTPLEMVHRWWRVLIIYFAGVAAGSLGTSVMDSTVKLAGASGGVYALITAHVSTIIMNWNDMEFPIVQLVIFLIIIVCDLSTAIYDRYVLDINEHIGYVAHFAGAVAGLLVGISVLRNITVTRTERVIWWISVVTYIILMGAMIIFNAAHPSFFPEQEYGRA